MRRLTTSAYGDVTYSNDWHVETACFQYTNTKQRVPKFYAYAVDPTQRQ